MRYIIALAAVIVAAASFVLAKMSLAILDHNSTASAVQVTQIHAEAQTTIMVGMLFLLALIAVQLTLANQPASAPAPSLLLPAPAALPDQQSPVPSLPPAQALDSFQVPH